jgi:hypothetical protein
MKPLENLKLDMIEVSNEWGIDLVFYPSSEDGFVMSVEAASRESYEQFAATVQATLSVSHEYKLANGNVLLLVDVKL